MENIELILALLGVMSALVVLARRINIPYPILLVVGGLAISLVPNLPRFELEPDLVFLLFLPPIITSAGYYTPIRDFRFNLRSILLLAVGCVLFTTTVIAVVTRIIIPEIPWAAAFALGAIIAPPDAIAATSIADRLNLPRRIVTVLEGESLLNDASALVAYRFAIAAAVAGTFSPGMATLDFLVSSFGGLAIGLAIGWIVIRLLALIDDTAVEVILTFLATFTTYLAAENLHVSGVLATVALGVYVGRQSVKVMSPQTRLQSSAVWNTVILMLNGLVFIIIGLQLPRILEGLEGIPLATLAGYALAICAALIVSRFVWVFPGTYLPRFLSAKIRARDPYPPWQWTVVVSWAGMRGIVSLAAALALPRDFPERDLILFLTFAVILVTLVVQGLSLAPLIRGLRVVDNSGVEEREEAKARLVAAMAGQVRLGELAEEDWVHPELVTKLERFYEARRIRYNDRYHGRDNDEQEEHAAAYSRLQRELLDAEIDALLKLRDSDYINDEILRRVQRELDLERLRLDGQEA